MKKEKKRWETPKLICLYRGRPEEAILAVCKRPGKMGPSPGGMVCDATRGTQGCQSETSS